MIRKVFAQQKVLALYRAMDHIDYPIIPKNILPSMQKETRILSYQEMADISGCSILDVAILCKSMTGATHYDARSGRCLVLYNDTGNPGRALWTQCHELGHICMGHLDYIEGTSVAEGDSTCLRQFEQEADYFAWNLIAPMPIMRELKVRSAYETRERFGLSSQAAQLHYDRYMRWERSHIKTSWENIMLRLFRAKQK